MAIILNKERIRSVHKYRTSRGIPTGKYLVIINDEPNERGMYKAILTPKTVKYDFIHVSVSLAELARPNGDTEIIDMPSWILKLLPEYL